MSDRESTLRDAQTDALIQTLIDSGYPWCHNCNKEAENCNCKDPYYMEREIPIEPQSCTKCGKSREACRCKHPQYIKGEKQ